MGKQSAAASPPCRFPQPPVLHGAISCSPQVACRPPALGVPAWLVLVPDGTALPKGSRQCRSRAQALGVPTRTMQDMARGQMVDQQKKSLKFHAGSSWARTPGDPFDPHKLSEWSCVPVRGSPSWSTPPACSQ